MGNVEANGSKGERKPLVRPWILILGAIVVLVSVGAIAARPAKLRTWLRRRGWLPESMRLETNDEAARARSARMHALASVALAPLPAAIPLVERPGVDAYGYPRSYVDSAAMRSLLAHEKYVELSLYLEQFQQQAEADFHKEYFIADAADSFDTADLELNPAIDAWVKATPDSFAPYLARGIHGLALGSAARGTSYSKDTNRQNFTVMNAALDAAKSDLDAALVKNPHLVIALRHELQIAMFRGKGAEFQAAFAQAARQCAACFQFRVTQQYGLEPRWGGDYRAMASAAHAADPHENPRFVLLAGYATNDRAEQLLEKKFADDALREIESACALGDSADFLETKARILWQLKRLPEATAALSTAIDLRPSRSDLIFLRADSETVATPPDWQAAYLDLSLGLRIDPSSTEAKRIVARVARGLSDAGWAEHQRHEESNAIRLLDESLDIWPARETEQRHSEVLTAGFHNTDAELEALTKAADAAPHDEYLHARLDYALSVRKDWPRIAEMWTAYIAQNPTDGRAYFEVAGTYQQEHEYAAARANLTRACELGVSAACALAKGHR